MSLSRTDAIDANTWRMSYVVAGRRMKITYNLTLDAFQASVDGVPVERTFYSRAAAEGYVRGLVREEGE